MSWNWLTSFSLNWKKIEILHFVCNMAMSGLELRDVIKMKSILKTQKNSFGRPMGMNLQFLFLFDLIPKLEISAWSWLSCLVSVKSIRMLINPFSVFILHQLNLSNFKSLDFYVFKIQNRKSLLLLGLFPFSLWIGEIKILSNPLYLCLQHEFGFISFFKCV